ncbi:MAG TPA: transcriptional regulator NrdR, partial [Kofleriaceae bacterium]
MRCPFCTVDERDKVIETRVSKDGKEIRRRRECEACDRRFTTYERIEESMPVVVKADGRREPFDRNKI